MKIKEIEKAIKNKDIIYVRDLDGVKKIDLSDKVKTHLEYGLLIVKNELDKMDVNCYLLQDIFKYKKEADRAYNCYWL